MPNPFFYGRTVDGDAFINRKKELQSLTSELERGQSVILFSPRRYGKTSLIKQVIQRLKKKKVLCFYLDLFPITSLEQFYSSYSTALVANLKTPVKSTLGVLHSLLPIIKPKLVYSEPGIPSVQIEANFATLRSSKTLRQLFDSVDNYCLKRKVRGTIIFDEFQEIVTMEKGDALEREMRSAFQHHKNVSYAFLGSKIHLMNNLFKDKNRPFYNFGAKFELETISENEWIKHILNKFKEGGYQVDESVANAITDISQGHPYYTQLLCSEIWETCHVKKEITHENIKTALQNAVDKENHAFQELWDSLSRHQRKIVYTIACDPEVELFSTKAINKHGLGAQSSIHRTASQLVKRGILIKKTGRYRLVDPFVRQWIEAN